jgi:LSD1 subclass zinc finger protein
VFSAEPERARSRKFRGASVTSNHLSCSAFKSGVGMADNTGEPSMPAQIICPNLRCRKILSVPDEARGKQVRCQHCQTMLRVPENRSKPEPVPPVAGKGH